MTVGSKAEEWTRSLTERTPAILPCKERTGGRKQPEGGSSHTRGHVAGRRSLWTHPRLPCSAQHDPRESPQAFLPFFSIHVARAQGLSGLRPHSGGLGMPSSSWGCPDLGIYAYIEHWCLVSLRQGQWQMRGKARRSPTEQDESLSWVSLLVVWL